MLFDDATYAGFCNQLRKTGAPAILSGRLSRVLTSAGALAGAGAGVGAAAGAAHGAYSGYRDARAQGAGVGGAIGAGLGGAPMGAARGAALGGVLGGVGGAGFSAVSRQRAESLRKVLTERSALARFGQRQVHGVTGAVPKGGLGQLRMDASDRLRDLDRLKGSKDVGKAGRVDKLLGRTEQEVATRRIGRAEKAHRAAQEAEDAGMTSIPGLTKSVKERGLIPTIGTGLKTQLSGADPLQKALFIGGAGMTAAQVAPRQEGETGAHHALRAAGGIGHIGLNAVTGGLPIATQMALDGGANAASQGAVRIGRRFRTGRSSPVTRNVEHGKYNALHEEPSPHATMEMSPRMSEGGQ